MTFTELFPDNRQTLCRCLSNTAKGLHLHLSFRATVCGSTAGLAEPEWLRRFQPPKSGPKQDVPCMTLLPNPSIWCKTHQAEVNHYICVYHLLYKQQGFTSPWRSRSTMTMVVHGGTCWSAQSRLVGLLWITGRQVLSSDPGTVLSRRPNLLRTGKKSSSTA